MKVIIVDDHELIREGLKKVTAREPDIEVVGEASNSDELFELLNKHEVDIVILDISMPGRSGIDIITDIKIQGPNTKILIHTMHPEDRFAVQSLRAGGSGYITKNNASKSLVEALRKIYDGRKYISSSLAEQLTMELERNYEKPLHESLSSREFEVMRFIAQGKAVRDIAEILCISTNTVSSYRSRIMEKMRMKTNAEIIRYAVENNLLL
ncbi:MAG TPA: DNA-binding response regulator [Ignavibacteriales bacterium]|nr:DNA-binding response regulator [Ignavibacteriales bacterium]